MQRPVSLDNSIVKSISYWHEPTTYAEHSPRASRRGHPPTRIGVLRCYARTSLIIEFMTACLLSRLRRWTIGQWIVAPPLPAWRRRPAGFGCRTYPLLIDPEPLRPSQVLLDGLGSSVETGFPVDPITNDGRRNVGVRLLPEFPDSSI
jgi:hypothetical protein